MSYIGEYVQITESTQEALDLKASISYVDSALAFKADTTVVDTALALKADTTVVDTALALKSDLTYVDNGLALKSDLTYVDTALALKADTTAVDTALALKADTTVVDTALALKADTTVVDTALALKADTTVVDTQLALKSDLTYVDTQLALKADTETFESIIISTSYIVLSQKSITYIASITSPSTPLLELPEGLYAGQRKTIWNGTSPRTINIQDPYDDMPPILRPQSISSFIFNGTIWIGENTNISSYIIDTSTLNWGNSLTNSLTKEGNIKLDAGNQLLINNIGMKDVAETLTNKTINTASNTLLNVKNAIAVNDLTISQTSGLQTALDLKADKDSVESALNQKTDLDRFNEAITRLNTEKADNGTVDIILITLDEKANITYVDEKDAILTSAIALKSSPDTTETLTNKTIDATSNTIQNIKNAIGVNDLTISQINQLQLKLDLKANNLTMYALLEDKASIGYVIEQLYSKTDRVYVDAELLKKGDKTYIDSQDALKADLTYVDEQLNLKADLIYVDALSGEKANLNYVNEELDKKADLTYVDSQLALKSASDTTETLTNKTIDATSNTIQNISSAIADDALTISQVSGLRTALDNSAVGGQTIAEGSYISVDNTSPSAPIVSLNLPTNTLKNNMLIASATGDLSWTTGPISGGTYYVNDNVNDLSTVLTEIGTQQGAQVIVSSGSFGGSQLYINADNLAIIGPNCVPPIVELVRAVNVSGTRIRMSHIQFDGNAGLGGNSCRYFQCDFPQNVVVGSGSNTGYITLENCEFASGKTITINAIGNSSAIYFINCNIGGATVVVNSASPLQVIFSNCAGFLSLPLTTKATLVGLNVLASGVINNVVQRTLLASGRGTAGQVLTSGGDSGNDTWTTPSAGGGGGGWVGTATSPLNMAGYNITGLNSLTASTTANGEINLQSTLNCNGKYVKNIPAQNPFSWPSYTGQVLTAVSDYGAIQWKALPPNYPPCFFSNTRPSGVGPHSGWYTGGGDWRYLPINTIDDPDRQDYALEHVEGNFSAITISDVGKYEVTLNMAYYTEGTGVSGRLIDIDGVVSISTNNILAGSQYAPPRSGCLIGHGYIQTTTYSQRFYLQGYFTSTSNSIAEWGKANNIPNWKETYAQVVIKRIS